MFFHKGNNDELPSFIDVDKCFKDILQYKAVELNLDYEPSGGLQKQIFLHKILFGTLDLLSDELSGNTYY